MQEQLDMREAALIGLKQHYERKLEDDTTAYESLLCPSAKLIVTGFG